MNRASDLDISVIIPFKDKAAMTLDCVRSFLKYGPTVSEILLLSNNSSQVELDKIKDFIKGKDNIVVKEYNHPFNYQKLNNWAVEKTTAPIIMFLNNDTELRPSSVGLIEEMTEKALQPDVGIVGCLLLFGDESTIQHAGVYLMPQGLANHLYAGQKLTHALRNNKNLFPYDVKKDRPLTAVTGAVNILERKKFVKVGGFDEKFIIGGGDVDLCLRLNKSGYQTWYLGGNGKKYILHKESQSRAFKPIPYSDFFYSYLSYIQGFDPSVGDPFLPKVTKDMKLV